MANSVGFILNIVSTDGFCMLKLIEIKEQLFFVKKEDGSEFHKKIRYRWKFFRNNFLLSVAENVKNKM